ncbi:MXAN_6640 family putative metalloprotease [Nannocystis pusilla]|uniref:MXAN_6640 family putative metalloprotease n=1 Tax=Nannocystis pusilla TaxID=889268 RepID=UPI003B7C217A
MNLRRSAQPDVAHVVGDREVPGIDHVVGDRVVPGIDLATDIGVVGIDHLVADRVVPGIGPGLSHAKPPERRLTRAPASGRAAGLFRLAALAAVLTPPASRAPSGRPRAASGRMTQGHPRHPRSPRRRPARPLQRRRPQRRPPRRPRRRRRPRLRHPRRRHRRRRPRPLPRRLRPPTPRTEAEHDLGPLGGSDALDIYLVDFAGAADGHFGHDACDPDACAGHLLLENDFAGYAYADLAEAVDTVVSHELFHAVQSAYVVDLPVWFSEGTAVWAERAYRPDSRDFLRLCDAYLADTGRSLFKPPAGPVPAFAYGTALWWDFLIERHGPDLVDALLQIGGAPDLPAALAELLLERSDDLRPTWLEFSAWNLATGSRAGARDSYPYADQLAGVAAEQDGSPLADDDRFFSLTARYYRLDHPGGPMWFGLAEAAPGLEFALQAVAAGAADGPVEPPQLAWDGADPEPRILADLPAGGYWLAVVNPVLSDMSIQAHLCAAATRDALACVDPLPAPESTGDATTGDTTTGDADTGDTTTDDPAPWTATAAAAAAPAAPASPAWPSCSGAAAGMSQSTCPERLVSKCPRALLARVDESQRTCPERHLILCLSSHAKTCRRRPRRPSPGGFRCPRSPHSWPRAPSPGSAAPAPSSRPRPSLRGCVASASAAPP